MPKERKSRESLRFRDLLAKLEAKGDPEAFMKKLRSVAGSAKIERPAKNVKSKLK